MSRVLRIFASCCLFFLANGGTYDDWPQYKSADNNMVTIVHLFEWKWTDIARECAWLKDWGYGAVQVSPPQEHIIVTNPMQPWWQRYQPVSYKLVSRSGNEADFARMVATCNNNGVRIIVDAVINHMVGDNQAGTGSGGCTFQGFRNGEQFPCVPYGVPDFNDPKCKTSDGSIHDYSNIFEVRECELQGLLDLDQSHQYVRDQIAAYFNHMIDLGIAGIRIDAAKHIWPADIKSILDSTKNLNTTWFKDNQRMWVSQEVKDMGGEAISEDEYIGNGRVTNFRYSLYVSDAVHRNQNFKYFYNFGVAWNMMQDNDCLNFIDNHDSQRSDAPAILNYKAGQDYTIAVGYMLAWPYGINRVMSSYDFYYSDQSPPNNGAPNYETIGPGFTSDGTCAQASGWICEHRWPMIRNMAKFRQICNFEGYSNVVTDEHRIAFSRGQKGFFALNNQDTDWPMTFQTGLSQGSYCDVIDAEYLGDHCVGAVIDVDAGGYARVTVKSKNMIAIHIGAKIGGVPPPTPPQTGDLRRTVIFIHKQTTPGQFIFTRGGIDEARIQGCTADAFTDKCAIRIIHQTSVPSTFTDYLDWRNGDTRLDWWGAQAGQGTHLGAIPIGTPFAYSTNNASEIGYQPLNIYGPSYWMVDVMMDCSEAYMGKYFEIKTFQQNGDGWEPDITQANCDGDAGFNKPFNSINHIGQCGKINVFEYGSNSCTVTNFQS